MRGSLYSGRKDVDSVLEATGRGDDGEVAWKNGNKYAVDHWSKKVGAGRRSCDVVSRVIRPTSLVMASIVTKVMSSGMTK